jgi:hypothetical protein
MAFSRSENKGVFSTGSSITIVHESYGQWWIGRHPLLGLRHGGRQSHREGVQIGRNI